VCVGGNGGINCLAKCFNNDFREITVAIDAVQCVYGTCGMACVGPQPVAAPFSDDR
jgi:hypothetical protein